MAEGVSRYLGNSEAEMSVKEKLKSAVESMLYFLDISESFSDEMVNVFAKAVDSYLSEQLQINKHECADPDLFDGHIERISELQKLLKLELSHRSSAS